MRRLNLTFITVFILMIPFTATAQDSLNVTKVAELYGFWGEIQCMTVSGSYAYFLDQVNRLQVVDVNDPGQPFIVTEMPVGTEAWNMVASPRCLYLAGKDSLLYFIDITDPAEPQIVNIHFMPYDYFKIDLARNHLCIVTSDFTFLMLDVTDPLSPVQTGECPVYYTNSDLAVKGNYVYTASDGLSVIDISDPANPYEVHYIFFYGGDVIAVSENTLCTCSYSSPVIRILDITNPLNPTFCSTCSIDIQVEDMVGNNNYIYGGSSDCGLFTISVMDPYNPVAVDFDSFGGLDRGGFQCVIQDDFLYTCRGSGGFFTYDLNHPRDPVQLSELTHIGSMEQVVLEGNYAYILDYYNGLKIVDISDPFNPCEVGNCPEAVEPLCIDIDAEYAFVGIFSNWSLLIIDITEPSHPVIAYQYPEYGCRFIKIVDEIAYLNTGAEAILLDFSDPAAPVFLSSCDYGGIDMVVSNSHVYLPMTLALNVIDCTNPLDPQAVFNLPYFYTRDYAAGGDYLYTTGNFNPLITVLDISIPSIPVIVGYKATSVNGSFLHYHDNHLYQTAGNDGLIVYDAEDPLDLEPIGYYKSGSSMLGVAASGSYACAVEDIYFRIYDCSQALPVEPGTSAAVPRQFTVTSPYPNPFNPVTKICYTLPVGGYTEMKVYDIAGRELTALVDGWQIAGTHEAIFDATALPSGIYIYRLRSGSSTAQGKMVLMK